MTGRRVVDEPAAAVDRQPDQDPGRASTPSNTMTRSHRSWRSASST